MTGHIKAVTGSDGVQREIHWIIVLADVVPNLQQMFPGSSEEDCNGGGLRTFDALRVIMGHLGYKAAEGYNAFE